MNQLLMAAARGARIVGKESGKLQKYMWVTGWDHGIEYRIHPDDEHLRFGPISTALREAAFCKDASESAPTLENEYQAIGWFLADPKIEIGSYRWSQTNEIHRSLFLLILAEALAEEGL